jgi:hypothetical protein
VQPQAQTSGGTMGSAGGCGSAWWLARRAVVLAERDALGFRPANQVGDGVAGNRARQVPFEYGGEVAAIGFDLSETH